MVIPDAQIRSVQSLLALRVVVGCLLVIHGIARFWFDGITPFGAWLDTQGIPAGLVIAYAVTLLEIFGAPLLALGVLVFPLCLAFSTVYFFGIVLVHAPEGWFVVGLGRNGMEYSVLLIVCLLSIAYQHLPVTPAAAEQENTHG